MQTQPSHAISANGAGKYIPALDGLRGVAILLVISYHYFVKYTNWVQPGWSGVDLFFVLSGYLITKRLIENNDHPNRYVLFYRNRALRILPLYYLVLILFYAGIYIIVSPQNIHRFDFYLNNKARYLLFLQNWLFLHTRPPEGHLIHLWSLAIEEQFYLVWPLFLYAFYKNKHFKNILWGIIIFVLVFRNILYYFNNQPIYYFHTLCRIDPLACGALIYFVSPDKKQAAIIKWLGIAGALVIIAGILVIKTPWPTSAFNTTIGYSAFAFLFASVLYNTIHNPGSLTAVLKNPALRFIGKISFGLYIFHLLVLDSCLQGISTILQQLFHAPVVKYLPEIICLLISFILSIISYFFYESYFLKLKNNLTR
ncbi:Peptidoglycan/LPS O-acetylase OafA/YrhL, contains acyltransferase and SGNH-hydrolase domains [Niastella yeongjuensis]|nr:Peptidoglycan/LPS O-acetylase OafA/YrhL, contains acyltransferase and SGNH-hydrolase domains [Niastella yeongjuensis]